MSILLVAIINSRSVVLIEALMGCDVLGAWESLMSLTSLQLVVRACRYCSVVLLAILPKCFS